VREIDDLIDRLLASSRLEFNAMNKAEIDSQELLRRVLERADVKDPTVLVVNESVRFQGDLNLLRRALANVIDNAIRHGGGVAQIGARINGQKLEFFIRDRGGPEKAKQFAQQWSVRHRAEPSANGGLGLGLRLVERIAQSHGGILTVTALETGAQVTLSVATSS
jgi:signal transduction histidine kinase